MKNKGRSSSPPKSRDPKDWQIELIFKLDLESTLAPSFFVQAVQTSSDKTFELEIDIELQIKDQT